MKIKTFFAAVAVAASLAASGYASAAMYKWEGANDVGASINFLGSPLNQVTFPNVGVFDFVITRSDDMSLDGLKGTISTSGFSVGPITTVIGGLEIASVIGTGTFLVFDGVDSLTADLKFDEISSYKNSVGLSFSSLVNLTNVAYSGSNAGLLAVLNSIDPAISIAATFVPNKPLTELFTKNPGEIATSYAVAFSGQPVPEPSTVALLSVGLGMVGFSLARARRR